MIKTHKQPLHSNETKETTDETTHIMYTEHCFAAQPSGTSVHKINYKVVEQDYIWNIILHVKIKTFC